ncbi:caveolae-associated protein 4a-like [Synchiropus splendidus]|uniref:caveolae-associated protein 4a-like n=1 Tax=Synchiropus splendidus TaxID=270530 RepID=UPI00237DAF94|nr:caveolae-associated protein 4a-like [Synchiropus splendidus]
MAERAGGEEAGGIMALLERVAGLMDGVQVTQQRMEERQLELESAVRSIQAEVVKLSGEHANTGAAVGHLLDKSRKISRHIKDVRVRVENQNLRVKKVEATQGQLLARNKFRVVIYQGDQEVKASTPGAEPAGGAAGSVEAEQLQPPPESDEEYMVVEEAESSAAARMKRSGLSRMESLKATFSRENLGSKVNQLGERIVPAERRQKIRQSGERLKESISGVPAKLSLKKERAVAEGQEGAAAPVPPPKGRRAAQQGAESEVQVYDMKQLS